MNADMPEESKQSKGGVERAKKLSPEERSAIAKQAATKRWTNFLNPSHVGQAIRQGEISIGETKLECFVLTDRRRVFNKKAIGRALGLKSDGGNAFIKTISSQVLRSQVGPELMEKIKNPIFFKGLPPDPTLFHGYDGAILVDICRAIMASRESLSSKQAFLAIRAEIILVASAKLGIYGLIDEATGFIADKRKFEYQELFKEFLREECRQWEKEFPDQFFDMMYKIYGLKRENPSSNKHPIFFAKFIRKFIYYPLVNSRGAILKQLDEKNPVVYDKGGRKYKMFTFLSDDKGMNSFRAHLYQVLGIGNSSKSKEDFERRFALAFPQPNDQGEFDFMSETSNEINA